MELFPGQCTTPTSLSVNSRICAKFSYPLVFFYLGWIFENGVRTGSWTDSSTYTDCYYDLVNNITNTTCDFVSDPNPAKFETLSSCFSQFYKIEVIPIMGDSFNTVFPLLLFCISFLMVTNLLNWILVKLKLEKYQFGQEILTPDQLTEGN